MRKIKWLHRLRIAWHYVKGDFMKNSHILTCYCGSVEMTPLDESIECMVNNTRVWSQMYKCDKCGAVCKEVQTWEVPHEQIGKTAQSARME